MPTRTHDKDGGGRRVLHIVAFIVIGLVVGYLVGSSRRTVALPTVLGLVGGFLGGWILHTHRYLSLVTAVVGALILAFLATLATAPRRR